jgi:hypothetical protein
MRYTPVENNLRGNFGTPEYYGGLSYLLIFFCFSFLAPEVLEAKELTPAIDWWAYGTIIFGIFFVKF